MTDQIISTHSRVVGIGDTMVDLFTRAAELPCRGGNIWSTAVSLSPGGTAANVSANIAQLGISSAFVGCVGEDPYGNYTIQEFTKIGVETSGIERKAEAFTGIVLTILDMQGERTFIACAKGAAYSLLSDEFTRRICFLPKQVVHSSGVCLVEEPARSNLLYLLHLAHQARNRIYFDPNLRLEGDIFTASLQEAQWQAISQSNVVLIGDDEIKRMCESDSLSLGAQQILQKGPELVVVKRGEKGAIVYSRDQEYSEAAFNVPICSTAGAGDSFDAGFIAAELRQASLRDALLYANAVAAIKVTRQGARAVPNHQEVIEFLDARGLKINLSTNAAELSQPLQ
jgi:sugar/nucleoside kinase (ribokinase family)